MSKKDHRELGQTLDLFSFHDIAPGAVFWHPKGWTIYQTLINFIRGRLQEEGYQEISTPVLVKSELFKKSGHWNFYRQNMFNLTIEKEEYSLKPMNCPEACLIYSTQTRSYQDLPIRFSDFGLLHRNELSGVLGGAFRVRQFTIDDAHHFIRPDQIQSEIHNLLLLVVDFYKSFGFKPNFYLATKPDRSLGDPKLWEEAENDLQKALEEAGVKFELKEKDGAFYGPKIDIHIEDSQGRDWQLATIQLDFQIPQRMKLEYVDRDGKPKQPVMVHRAILGSVERFVGILVEHFQGALPLWLSPVQAVVLSVSEKHAMLAKKIQSALLKEKIKAELDNNNKTVSAKIRDGTLQKVPYLIIIGDKENEENVSVRTREGKDLGLVNFYEFVKDVKEKIEKFQ